MHKALPVVFFLRFFFLDGVISDFYTMDFNHKQTDKMLQQHFL